jgi:hypothetical protein
MDGWMDGGWIIFKSVFYPPNTVGAKREENTGTINQGTKKNSCGDDNKCVGTTTRNSGLSVKAEGGIIWVMLGIKWENEKINRNWPDRDDSKLFLKQKLAGTITSTEHQ